MGKERRTRQTQGYSIGRPVVYSPSDHYKNTIERCHERMRMTLAFFGEKISSMIIVLHLGKNFRILCSSTSPFPLDPVKIKGAMAVYFYTIYMSVENKNIPKQLYDVRIMAGTRLS